MICLKKGGELVNPTERGLSTLHSAMKNMSDSCFNEQKASGILDDNSFLIPVKYHRICYQNYTSKHNQSCRQGIDFDQGSSTEIHDYLTKSGAEPMDVSKCLFCGCRPSNEESETSVFDEAFDKLISEIEADFFHGAAFSTSFLLSRYKIHLKECNYSEYEGYSLKD